MMPIKAGGLSQPTIPLAEPILAAAPTSVPKSVTPPQAAPEPGLLGGSLDATMVASLGPNVPAAGAALPGGISNSISTGEPTGKADGALGALDAVSGRNKAGSVADSLTGGQALSPLDDLLAKSAPPGRSLDTPALGDVLGIGGIDGKGGSPGAGREDLFGFGKSGETNDPGPPQGDRSSNPLDGMFSQGTAPVAVGWSDDEGVRYTGTGELEKKLGGTVIGDALMAAGTAIGTGLPSTPTGQALQQALHEIDSIGGSPSQPPPSETTKAADPAPTTEGGIDWGGALVGQAVGALVGGPVGSVVGAIVGGQSDSGGSKPSASQPVEGDENTIDPNVMAWLQGDLATMKQHKGGQNGGDTDPVAGDGTAFTGGSGALVDTQDRLLGGDTADPDATRPSGGDTTNSQQGGDIDFGPDHAGTPQTSGPEERQSSSGPLERPVQDAADGGQSNTGTAFDDVLAGFGQAGMIDAFSGVTDPLPAQPFMPATFDMF